MDTHANETGADAGVSDTGLTCGETVRIVRWETLETAADEECCGKLSLAVCLEDGRPGTLSIESAPSPDNNCWLVLVTGGQRYGADSVKMPVGLFEIVRDRVERLCASRRGGFYLPSQRRILMQLLIALENASGGLRSQHLPCRRPIIEARWLAERALLAVVDLERKHWAEPRSVRELLARDAEISCSLRELRMAVGRLERKPAGFDGEISAGRCYVFEHKYADLDAFLEQLIKSYEENSGYFAEIAAAFEAWKKCMQEEVTRKSPAPVTSKGEPSKA